MDRSISAADAIGKTADKIGVGVEATRVGSRVSVRLRCDPPILGSSSTRPATTVAASPVRFDADHMAVTIETFRLHRWQPIPIVELRT